VDLAWILRGNRVDLAWILRGSCVDLAWILRGAWCVENYRHKKAVINHGLSGLSNVKLRSSRE